MPAVVLFARHRPKQRTDQVTVVQIPWTPSGARTHSFEVAPSDVITLTLDEIQEQPLKLKAAAVGRRRDLLLLDDLTSAHRNLGEQLSLLDTTFQVGLIRGAPENQTRDARPLKGLDVLQVKDMQHFNIPDDLPTFSQSKAQWPRSREIYQAPLLIVKEMLLGVHASWRPSPSGISSSRTHTSQCLFREGTRGRHIACHRVEFCFCDMVLLSDRCRVWNLQEEAAGSRPQLPTGA